MEGILYKPIGKHNHYNYILMIIPTDFIVFEIFINFHPSSLFL